MTECNNCGYEWEYGGDLQKATCPSCGAKTEVEDAENADEGADDRPTCLRDGCDEIPLGVDGGYNKFCSQECAAEWTKEQKEALAQLGEAIIEMGLIDTSDNE